MTETRNSNWHLTSGRLLAKNTLWNLLGTGAPTIVAVFSIPMLIHQLGKDRFGVLALAWVIIGYASLFDFGLGRALTQVVAKKIGAEEGHEVVQVVWTSLALMTGLGILGAGLLFGISPLLVHRLLKIPESLQGETLKSFCFLAISIPVVIVGAGLRGMLEAHQRFDLVAYLRIPLGVFGFLGPLLVLPFSRSLVPVVGILVLGRFAGTAAFFWLCLRVAPELRRGVMWHGPSAVPLLRFGGWMTVSNIVGPLMVSLDRFVIAGLVSVTAVAYYATPYEVVTKLWIIPGAFLGVMFPAFSTSFARDQGRTAFLYGRSVKYIFLVLFPVVLSIVAMAQSGLKLWLGTEFAKNSTLVLQWLTIGVFVNSLAQVPFAMLQGTGRPDLTAKLHLLELPCYLTLLFLLIRNLGIEGAAIAWSARAVFDALALFVMAKRFLPRGAPMPFKTKLLVAAALVTLVLAVSPKGLVLKATLLAVCILIFLLVAWFLILTPEERSLAQSYR